MPDFSSKSVRRLTYDEIKSELKRCILKHDNKRMQELSISRWYDSALSELRKCMGITASEAIECASGLDTLYEIVESGGQWYVTCIEDGDVLDGPFDSYDEALLSVVDTDEDDEDEYESRLAQQRAEKAHAKYVSRFNFYARKTLPGRFMRNGHVATRNYTALERFIESFNKKYPEAKLKLRAEYSAWGSIYSVQ